MNQMLAIYQGGLRTEGKHIKSGNSIITDAPTDNNGKGQAYSPTDLTCASLASCMLTIMGILAERNQWDITNTTAAISKKMAENPRRIEEITIEITIPLEKLSALDEKSRAMLKHAAKNCPVALSLHPAIKQNYHFQF